MFIVYNKSLKNVYHLSTDVNPWGITSFLVYVTQADPDLGILSGSASRKFPDSFTGIFPDPELGILARYDFFLKI